MAIRDKSRATLPRDEHLDYIDDKTAALLLNTPKSARVLLWTIVLFLVVATAWASQAQLDKVTVGQGKVIPSSQLQVVQNLEGGLVKALLVKEGDKVKKGQRLILIDDTLFRANFREREQELLGLRADKLRLQALLTAIRVDETAPFEQWRESILLERQPLSFPDVFTTKRPDLIKQTQARYQEQLSNIQNQLYVTAQKIRQKEQELVELESRIANLEQSQAFAQEELDITRPLADEGVVPKIDLLKLQRQLNDTQRELSSAQLSLPSVVSALREAVFQRIDVALTFRTDQQEQLNQVEKQIATMSEGRVGLQDKVSRTVVTSPVNGTVKKLHVNTVGGVIQPGMDIIEIVPSEDNLLVEAKIAPQDIAFLRPGLNAVVKFSAYDFTVYGGLDGRLETISADTIEDEEGNSFYLAKIRAEKDSLGKETSLPIIPGMTASVDIITGKRTVLDYLLNPITRAQKTALRE
ncbi:MULTISPECIES: HlyD family type I secretion periplasmic adaptor subunit [Salinivibrio]|uniref:Membrane fusion protein (MFP) family protein n=1 Tax=Salinivibrio kushneri TaxID=1908198 RepID=A0AB36K4Y3_9GAMM|nr:MULTISPECIES: HlyD family type I secretion periplasmic adaptor subunit [Salinivibrio]ODP99361.1 hemolysin secretion protein D [Salinivibrio sp. BNH]OOE35439.1 hemolysin secretion protein D [Salinivibrio kushneri]OOE37981.1 hemolysin secretion protein D [Salinivibrio kushneri]OOE40601.1 hemolysin secretion protein D [Salinivibrio kushneri]OOE43202.1 hemolysin secretion protein D [Salinivibrio kushneri]